MTKHERIARNRERQAARFDDQDLTRRVWGPTFRTMVATIAQHPNGYKPKKLAYPPESRYESYDSEVAHTLSQRRLS